MLKLLAKPVLCPDSVELVHVQSSGMSASSSPWISDLNNRPFRLAHSKELSAIVLVHMNDIEGSIPGCLL